MDLLSRGHWHQRKGRERLPTGKNQTCRSQVLPGRLGEACLWSDPPTPTVGRTEAGHTYKSTWVDLDLSGVSGHCQPPRGLEQLGKVPPPNWKLPPQCGELGQDMPTSPWKRPYQNQTFELPLRSADLAGEARWGSPKRCCCLVAKLRPTLRDPMDCSPPGSSVHGILQARYWSGLPRPLLGVLPNPGIETETPAWQADSLPVSHQGSSPNHRHSCSTDNIQGGPLRGAQDGPGRLRDPFLNSTTLILRPLMETHTQLAST